MKNKIGDIFRKNLAWFIILFASDSLFFVFLWLIDAAGFIKIYISLLLGTAALCLAMVAWIYITETRKQKAFMEFMENPGQLEDKKIVQLTGIIEKECIYAISSHIKEMEQQICNKNENMQEYEEYIETWVHEIKTPLALMTFVLDNCKEEIAPKAYERLEYVRSQMQEDIQRMLYYTRIKTANTDYLFEKVSLKECCQDVISNYEALLKERGFAISNQIQEALVVTDKRGLEFIINQIISNSIKYAKLQDEKPGLLFYTDTQDESGDCILGIRDNGVGVKVYDRPFIFNKGFTGESGEERKKATGMGLYLAKHVADALKIRIQVVEEYTDGFEIQLLFPKIN